MTRTKSRDEMTRSTTIRLASRGSHAPSGRRRQPRVATLERLIRAMAEANDLLHHGGDRPDLFDSICTIVVEHAGFRMAWIGLPDQAAGEVRPVAVAGHDDGYVAAVKIPLGGTSARGLGPTGRALLKRTTQITEDMETDPSFAPWREAARDRGYRSSGVFPFAVDDGALGVLNVYAAAPGAFAGEVITLLEQLADHLGHTLQVTHVDEVRRRAESEMRRALHYNRNLIETSLDPLVTISPDGKITDVNEATVEVTGVSRERLIGSDFSEYFTEPEQAREGYRAVLARGEVRHYELTIRSVSGRTTDVRYNAAVYRNEAGEIEGVFAAARDVTERNRAQEALQQAYDELERRVEERTAELARANHELEAFSYSVSHDLRAPLRAIDGFSQALAEDLGPRLGDQERVMLDRIRANAQNMGQLIDDLLKLSRLTRTDLRHERVDLSALARRAVAELRLREPGRDVEFVTTEGLEAEGDPQLLRVALENLLGNAWKFTGKQVRARIEFGATSDERGDPAFFVRDDGVGFDMAYAGKLFGPFQRLHSRRDFEGSGIGLATVQRIVQRHGGRVWAEGSPNKGASFYFVLPPSGFGDRGRKTTDGAPRSEA